MSSLVTGGYHLPATTHFLLCVSANDSATHLPNPYGLHHLRKRTCAQKLHSRAPQMDSLHVMAATTNLLPWTMLTGVAHTCLQVAEM